MSSAPEFWNLVAESRLLTQQQCQQLNAQFTSSTGAGASPTPRAIADWMIAKNYLSRFQATVLLGGRAGPFFYGDYKVYDRIEKGRLSGMFRAVHADTGHPVLLQFVTGPAAQDPQYWAALDSWLKTQTRLTHPQVARIFQTVDLQSFKFVVMEDLRGQSIAERLAAGKLPPQEASRIVRLAALGLTQFHFSGQVHGDIRPTNLWLEPSGNVKLVRDPMQIPGPLNLAEQDGELQSRADYLAPEFGHPGKSPDALTDIYGLGCTYYQLLAGQPPFVGGNVAQKLQRHATEAIQSMEPLGVAAQIGQVVAYMMAKNPAVRFQQASIVAEQVAPFVDPAMLTLPLPAPPQTLQAFEAWLANPNAGKAPAVVAPAVAAPAPAGGGLGIKIDTNGGAKPAVAVNVTSPAGPAAVAAPAFAVASAGGPQVASAVQPASGVSTTVTEPQVDSEERRKQEEKKKMMMIGGACGGAALLLIGLVLMFSGGDDPQPDGGDGEPPVAVVDDGQSDKKTNDKTGGGTGSGSGTSGTGSGGSGTPAAAVAAVKQTLVDDTSGQLLWGSPTSGPPVDFAFVPGDGGAFVIARPAEILANREGDRILQALGPGFQAARSSWESASGVPLSAVEQMIIGFHPESGRFPRVSVVVRLSKDGPAADSLTAAWGNPSESTIGSAKYYQSGNGWAYHVPPTGANKVFVMGHKTEVEGVAEKNGAPPLLVPAALGRLLAKTDNGRHVNILFDPKFLTGRGQGVFEGRERMREPMEWFLGNTVQAGLLSMHFDPAFYTELQLQSQSLNVNLAKEIRERMNETQSKVFAVARGAHPYWEDIAIRYPRMIEELCSMTRIGTDDDQAMLNAYLPLPAAHNLLFGGEMFASFGAAPVAVVAAANQPPAPKTIEELLTKPSTLSFDQNSLEFAMQFLEKEVKDSFPGLPFDFRIRILGDDLKLDGITRNQQIRDFEARKVPIKDILLKLVMKANPVTTVKTPDEEDQKLLWVIGPDPTDGKQIVLITTRQVATGKYTLPDVFKK